MNKQKNDKKQKKNNEMTSDTAQPWNTIPAWSGVEVSDELAGVPKGNIRRHIVLATHLEAQAPRVRTEEEEVRLADMRGAREVAEASLDHWRELETRDQKEPWGDTVSLLSSVTGTLAGIARSKATGVAERARAVSRKLVPPGLVLSRISPQEGWLEVKKVRMAYDGDPQLRAAVLQFVPEALMLALFDVRRARTARPSPGAHRAVGAVEGRHDDDGARAPEASDDGLRPVDGRHGR